MAGPTNPPTLIPSLLARFEYEAGRTSTADATKILLVEWEEDVPLRQAYGTRGSWTVEWKGRRETLRTVDPHEEQQQSGNERSRRNTAESRVGADGYAPPHTQTHRLYFLLPPGTAVPPNATVTFHPGSMRGQHAATSATATATAPTLPALFPAPLLALTTDPTSTNSKKGVLHTLWAKSRIAALNREIEAEQRERVEGIGLEMARGELDWICETFGVGIEARSRAATTATHESEGEQGKKKADDVGVAPASPMTPSTPTNPASPAGSNARIMNKMGGLRVGTETSGSASAEASSATVQRQRAAAQAQMHTPPQTGSQAQNPLSPEAGDVAVSSFAEIRGDRPGRPPEQEGKGMKPVYPARGAEGVASMDAVLDDRKDGAVGKVDLEMKSAREQKQDGEEEEEEGLFAVAMSPRSPEMERSPFSFR